MGAARQHQARESVCVFEERCAVPDYRRASLSATRSHPAPTPLQCRRSLLVGLPLSYVYRGSRLSFICSLILKFPFLSKRNIEIGQICCLQTDRPEHYFGAFQFDITFDAHKFN